MDEKKCTGCKRVLPLTVFIDSRKDAVRALCKPCREKRSIYQQTHKRPPSDPAADAASEQLPKRVRTRPPLQEVDGNRPTYNRLNDETEEVKEIRRQLTAMDRLRRQKQRRRRRGETITPSPLSSRANSSPMRRSSPSTHASVLSFNIDEIPLSPPAVRGPPAIHDSLLEPAVDDTQWGYVQDFHAALDRIHMETCNGCQERWFNMKIEDGVCSSCRRVEKKGDPPLFTNANRADMGSVPEHLPKLTEIEEMLIARVHVHIQVRQVKGQQYNYSGHTVNFMQNTQKIYRTLPLSVSQLDVILLKPASGQGQRDAAIERRFERDLRVRRDAVRVWLDYLRANHPDYRTFEFSQANLSALPEDGSIHRDLTSCEEPRTEQANRHPDNPELAEAADENYLNVTIESMVPDLRSNQTELEQIQEDLADAAAVNTSDIISIPTFHTTPVSEWDDKCTLRMTFPTLFPTGQGDIKLTRNYPISFADWIKHLLKYKDGRFARHPRFRYVVFNMLSREKAKKQAGYLCSKIDGTTISLEELQGQVVRGHGELVSHIVRSAAQIRGVRPFWNAKRLELNAMILNIGCPHLFFTVSAADMQWYDLKSHMPSFAYLANMTEQQHYRTVGENLQDNPHIAAEYLTLRFKAFLANVIRKQFDIADYWYRYEWQARGSGHIHGFLWLKHTPPPSTLSEVSRERLAMFWAQYVSAVNPNQALPQIGRNPASVPFAEQANTNEQLTERLNRYQRHTTCTEAYCLRKHKPSGELRCRFYFPQPHRETATVSRDQNPVFYKFLPERNDSKLNQYIPLMTMAWNANMDFAPCTSPKSVVEYIAKYASKSEVQSKTYQEIFATVTARSSTNRPFLSTAIRMINALIGERDWSAQEVTHHLLGLGLVGSSRETISLDLRPAAELRTAVRINDDGLLTKQGKSWLEKYQTRDSYTPVGALQPWLTVTLFEFVRDWDVRARTVRRRPRAASRVLNLFPLYSSEVGPDYENYCRVKMMLHHPFTDPETLKHSDGDAEPTFSAAYHICQATHFPHPHDPLDPLEDEGDDDDASSEFENGDLDPEQVPQPDFTVLAGRTGARDAPIAAYDHNLGTRALDHDYNWHSSDPLYEQHGEQDQFYPNAKALRTNIQRTANNPNTLQENQRVLFNTVLEHYEKELRGEPTEQLLMHVDGSAGTGKSYVIDMMSAHLYTKAGDYEKADPVIRAAPTGVAAFGIQGQTLHRILRLPIRTPFAELPNNARSQLQSQWKDCRYLFIDEKSMIGLKSLHHVDCRLREIFPRQGNIPFGGLNILLFGDFYQLPPVCSRALFDTGVCKRTDLPHNAGQQLYQRFNRTVVLTQIMRQQGEDTESRQFRTALDDLRNYTMTEQSSDFLHQRVLSNLPSDTEQEFRDALRIYATKDRVFVYNIKTLEHSGQPVILIQSTNTPQSGSTYTAEETGGLHSDLLLCKGSRMMITCNILTTFGLVNGTLGTLFDIVWRPGEDPFTTLPCLLLYKPDKYTGPSLFEHDGQPVIPILPLTKSWQDGSKQFSRTMFPIVIAFAITIHKSQGLTLDKVVMDIAGKDFTQGLTYVAVSRVRSVRGLLFDREFAFHRFIEKASDVRRMREEDKARRALQFIS